MQANPTEILLKNWGYPAFRPMQEDIINSVLAGRDTLALLPTGGGKSLCFQVPGLCMEGICLVVSPLIALMKDQVAGLKKRGIPAAAIFSGMSNRELDITFENACNGGYKFLYLSPERLKTDLAKARIDRMNVNLLAIDEAHCVSQWGYDFRPPYLQIAEIRRRLDGVPCLALTATATPEVVEDIQKRLAFGKNKQVFQQSFQRKNVSYSILYENDKPKKLLDIVQKVPGSGVIYARTRGETKEIAELLKKNQVPADFYHAGLTAEERSQKQDDWMSGKIRLMACTNAFGMGIDKPDVRLVVHMNLPDSLEGYFQEAGRGGRDGKKSFSVLLFNQEDARSLRWNFENSFPEIHELRRVYQALGSLTQVAVGGGEGESFDFDFLHFTNAYKLEPLKTISALKLLGQEGWIAVSESVTHPATMKVLLGREAFYDYQLKNRAFDKILTALFRSFTGMETDYATISEGHIANQLGIPLEQVVQTFTAMHRDCVIDYRPKKDKPQLTFLRERIAFQNLTIDPELFNFRKKRMLFRIESAIRFAERIECRSQQLLRYFGETESEKCGICDVCTGRNRSELTTDQFQFFEKKMLQLIEIQPLGIDEVLASFPVKQHDQARQALSFLLDDGRLGWSADEKLRLPK